MGFVFTPPRICTRVDKEVFSNVDFVRQNPMLANDADKFEFREAILLCGKEVSDNGLFWLAIW